MQDTEEENPAVMKSKLSAEAPEFIPKYALHLFQDTSESQDSLYQDFQRLANVRPNHLDTSGESAADSFNDAVFSLTSNPGPMEEYMKRIVDMLESGITDMAVIQNIIETLIEQSISEANFRFTGAKICKYLTHALRAHPAFSDFRGLFLQRCKKEFDIRETLLDNNIDRLCGLSMFIGELFLILEIETNGVTTRLGLLRKVISDLLRTLLSKPDDVTVKCATQLLKLTGTAIMETKDLPNSGNFDDTFDQIKSLEKHPQLNKTSHCLINSVLSRLQYNFGVDQQPSPVKPMASPQYSNSSFSNEPIFYNIDGKPISREEAGFAAADDSDFVGMSREEQEAYLQWEAETYASQQGWMGPGAELAGDNGWGEEPQEAWSTGMGMDDYTQWSAEQEQGGEYYPDYGNEMDDEMAAAYEMFLKESGQNRH
ncbi:polyadenylate-binding protein-interacting protein 1-like isoform X2 [Dreissena polymorpha]|uniref:polyadenylate-binding protein-interacting protein 1-like isoform X2 n=1 Tax=Dreissena polymorpha TaxID=45954 RepID=UPI002263BF04|nr:polyadenylate-binding protein-interacting protein 1-like isoform X2 [Dreissena polymorpha]